MTGPLHVIKLSDHFGDYLLNVECRKCRHTRTVSPHVFAKFYGWEAALADVTAKLRCSKCDAKDVAIVVHPNRRPRGRTSR